MTYGGEWPALNEGRSGFCKNAKEKMDRSFQTRNYKEYSTLEIVVRGGTIYCLDRGNLAKLFNRRK